MSELKPCPFCGGNLVVRHEGWLDHPKGKCILSGRAFHKGFIGQWNRRATTPEVTALVEALRPFAKAADIKLCGDWHDDESIQRTDVAFYVKFGDLRAASAAITEWEAANA